MAAIPWGRSVDIQTFYEQWHKDDPTKTLSDMMVYMTRLREEDEEQANRDAQEEMDEWTADQQAERAEAAEQGQECECECEGEGEEGPVLQPRRVQVIDNRLHPALEEGADANTFTAADLGVHEAVLELFFQLHGLHYGPGPYGDDHMPYEDMEEHLLEAVMDCVAGQAAAAAVAAELEAVREAEAMDRALL